MMNINEILQQIYDEYINGFINNEIKDEKYMFDNFMYDDYSDYYSDI